MAYKIFVIAREQGDRGNLMMRISFMEIASPENQARKDEGHCSKNNAGYHSKKRAFALLKANSHRTFLLFFEFFTNTLFFQLR